jgi:phage tail tape-measure protein
MQSEFMLAYIELASRAKTVRELMRQFEQVNVLGTRAAVMSVDDLRHTERFLDGQLRELVRAVESEPSSQPPDPNPLFTAALHER